MNEHWNEAGAPRSGQFQGEGREVLSAPPIRLFNSEGHISEPQEGRLKRTDLLDNHSWGQG